MDTVRIEPFDPETVAQVSSLLARAFVTNPINAAALGPAELVKNEVFFAGGLRHMKGSKWVAVDGSRIVGFVRWIDSPACRPSGFDKIRTIPTLMDRFGLRTTLRVSSWLSAWSKYDPQEPHCHLGPIGVDPADQGRGVGSRLMACYCEEMDRDRKAGYLETDRPENVRFYERFGFETVREVPVLGVPNDFMQREARRSRQVI